MKRTPDVIEAALIAPCGMDCALRMGFLRDLREKNVCRGCHADDAGKPVSCVGCRIKNCPELESPEAALDGQAFCFVCAKPFTRLKQLDKRYRSKYGMSMLENLAGIRELGLEEFVARERARWTCPGCGGVICHFWIANTIFLGCFLAGIIGVAVKIAAYRIGFES